MQKSVLVLILSIDRRLLLLLLEPFCSQSSSCSNPRNLAACFGSSQSAFMFKLFNLIDSFMHGHPNDLLSVSYCFKMFLIC